MRTNRHGTNLPDPERERTQQLVDTSERTAIIGNLTIDHQTQNGLRETNNERFLEKDERNHKADDAHLPA
jgi:hypothetical protein